MSPATDLSDSIAKEMGFPGIPVAVNPLKPDDVIINRQLGQLPPTCPVCERLGVTIFLYPTNSNPKGDLLFECLNAVGAMGAGHYEAIWRRGTNTWEPRPGSRIPVKSWEPPTLVKLDGGKTKKAGKGPKQKTTLQVTIVDKTKAKVSPVKPIKGRLKGTPSTRKSTSVVIPLTKKNGIKVEAVTARKPKIKLGIDPTAFGENDQPVVAPPPIAKKRKR